MSASLSAQHTPGPRLERKAFYCGTKPDGSATMKMGWVAHMPDGKVFGDETLDRGNYGARRWEPRYLTRGQLAEVLADTKATGSAA